LIFLCTYLLTSIIYIFNGLKINPYKRTEYTKNDELWAFNLKLKTWLYLGTTSFKDLKKVIPYKHSLLSFNNNGIEKIDILHNKITLFEHSFNSNDFFVKGTSGYYLQQFYYVVRKGNQVYLKRIGEKDFFGKKISETYVYKNNTWWRKTFLLYVLIPILLLFLTLWGYRFYKKRGKIVLLKNGLKLKNHFIELDSESLAILNVLLVNESVTSHFILNIVEKEQYSVAHNERLKVQKIKDLNLKLAALIETKEDLISSTKSINDKRIHMYTLKKTYFNSKKIR